MKVAMLANKKITSVNYNINTVNQIMFIFGIAANESERREIMNEASLIKDVKKIDPSIFLVDDLSKNKR